MSRYGMSYPEASAGVPRDWPDRMTAEERAELEAYLDLVDGLNAERSGQVYSDGPLPDDVSF